jgi:hypothetical protein
MKAKSSSLSFFTFKILLVFILVAIVFSAFTKCDAQAIVGKWKGVSVKNYYGAEYAKQIGKTVEEKSAKEAGNSEITFMADHRFVVNFTAPDSKEVTTIGGTWSATGDQLKLTMEPKYNPQKISTTASFTINGNILITTAVFAPASRIIKTISTSERL